MRIPTLIVITYLSILALPLHAQQQPDIRLLRNLGSYTLPTDIQIQSAARIGQVSLAVWGSIRSDGNGGYRRELRYQFLRDTVMMGSQGVVNDTAGEPYEKVWVMPFADRFAVLWNDKRPNANGLYVRWFDSAGTVMGDEMKVSTVGAVSVNNFNGLRNAVLISFKNGIVYTYWADGRLDQRAVAAPILGSSYLMNADTTVYSMKGMLLCKYKSLYDKNPMDSVLISAPGTLKVWTGTGCVARNPDGKLCVRFLGYSQSSITGWYYYDIKGCAGLVREDLPRLQLDTSRVVTTDSLKFLDYRKLYCSEQQSWGYNHKISIVKYCRGLIVYHDDVTEVYTRKNQPDTYKYSVADFGFRDDSTFATSLYPYPLGCTDEETLTILRAKSDTLSAVNVYLGSKTPYQLSSMLPKTNVSFHRYSPNLYLDTNQIVVSWMQSALGAFHIGEWNLEDDSTRYIGTGGNSSSVNYVLPSVAISRKTIYQVPAHNASSVFDAISYLSIRKQMFSYLFGFNRLDGGYINHDGGYINGDDDYPLIAFDPNDKNIVIPYWIYTQNKYVEYIIKANLSTDSIRLNHPLLHTYKGFSAIIPIDNDQCYLVIDSSRFLRVVKDTAFVTGAIRKDTTLINYRRLLGPYFIRYGARKKSSVYHFERYSLDKLKLLDTLELDIKEVPGNLCITQNPRDSAIVMVWSSSKGVRMTYLSKTLTVCRDTVLGEDLQNVRVSMREDSVFNAQCGVRNDTVYAIWNDNRTGALQDIYATRWTVPSGITYPVSIKKDTTVRDTTNRQTDRPNVHYTNAIRATPNPTYKYADITFTIDHSTVVRFAVYDMLGNEVQRKEYGALSSGDYEVRIERGSLVAGVYLVRIYTDTGVMQTKLMFLGNP